MATTPKRDTGKGLDQAKVDDVVEHWKIEGYDVYPYASWEGTHTSRGANIVRDGEHVIQVRNLSEARAWIREQVSRRPRTIRAFITLCGERDGLSEALLPLISRDDDSLAEALRESMLGASPAEVEEQLDAQLRAIIRTAQQARRLLKAKGA